MNTLVKISCLIFFNFCIFISLPAQKLDISKDWRFMPGDDLEWAKPGFDDSKWDTLQSGGSWESQGYKNLDGFGWFRKKIIIPSSIKDISFLKDSLKIFLGNVADCDQTYLNGVLIGENGGNKSKSFETAYAYDALRRYCISTKSPLIRWDEENVIAVRVFNQIANGGLYKGKLYVSVVSLYDYITLSVEIDKIKFKKDNTTDQYFYFSNNSKVTKIQGVLNVKLKDNSLSPKTLFEKNYEIAVLPFSKDSILINFPFFENSTLTYEFP